MQNNKLKVIIPNNNLPERNYIITVLLGEFLGINFEIQVDAGNDHYEICLENNNRIIIEDHFFSKYADHLTYLNENNLPKDIQFSHNKFAPENDIPIIYGSNTFELKEADGKKEIICGMDLFASAFFMLTRWEEYVCNKKDELQRFPGRSSISFNYNFLHRPVVNEYAAMLGEMIQFLGRDDVAADRIFAFYITHDVDFVLKWYSFSRFIRALSGDLLKRKSLKLFCNDIADYLMTVFGIKEDPYNTFDFLMSSTEHINVKSYFNFMSEGKVTKKSANYKFTHPFVKKLLHTINHRGHIIGFHPGLSTFSSPEQWVRELNHLKSHSPQNIFCGRQHYLQFEVPNTWQIWNDAGMLWESSLSYDDEPGFRTGSCYAYSVFNFLTRKNLELKERPLIIMDKSLVLEHKELSADQLIDNSIALIKRIRKYNGDFVLLWHNSSFNTIEWKNYKRVYLSILDYLKAGDK